MQKTDSFLKKLLTAGLLSFLAAIFGHIYSTNADRKLQREKFYFEQKQAERSFQYQLLNRILESDQEQRISLAIHRSQPGMLEMLSAKIAGRSRAIAGRTKF